MASSLLTTELAPLEMANRVSALPRNALRWWTD